MTRTALLAAVTATIALSLTACGGESESDPVTSASGTGAATVTAAPTASSAAPTTVPAAPTTVPAAEKPPTPAHGGTEPVSAPTPEPSAAPAPPPTAAPVADPCAEVTREYLITTLRMTGLPRYPLADLQQARCSGTFASAMAQPEGTLHPVMYLFEYSEQNGHTHWRVIDVGEALDCVNRHGVPANVGSAIGCAS
ncbi:hypothetical protein SAMN04244553_1775 [Nocardia amikacinitolerans]|uniref:Uncharacterized protein n=1 Tax=Nocardia amikacinitolerans TaxID=756689 RepID=A0A285L4U3_9NOCA|nr:hypothetical protein SAMN04244553_1775 [Nocardia amikacinitolerans]